MRPLRIEFSAFGPYPDRVVVDFAALAHRGLFVIAGDTGTGKTTIFDAMLYALFGRTRVDAEEVRSHHADSDVRTAVRFDFEADGTHYVVERAPAQPRPKTRGTGTTTQAASASLVRVAADGTTTALTNRSNDVTANCATLVGLDATQFQRVVLLPQGEFARLLTAPAGEREALLTKLFGGAAHEELAVALRHRATTAREAVADVTSRAAELRSVWAEVVANAAATHLVDLPDPIDAEESDVAALVRATDVLGEEATTAEHLATSAEGAAAVARTRRAEDVEAARRFAAAASARAELADLDGRRSAVTTAADNARLAADAARVLQAWEVAAGRRGSADELATQRDMLVADIRTLLGTAGAGAEAPPEHLAVVAARRSAELTEQARILEAHSDAAARQRAAEEAVEATIAARTAAAAIHDARRAERDGLAADLPTVEALDALVGSAEAALALATSAADAAGDLADVAAAAAAAQEAVSAARSAYDDALHHFTASQAPVLAQLLTTGSPCPVCGSAEHPAPATDPTGSFIERAHLDDLGAQLDRARATAQKLALDAATLHERLGSDAITGVEELRARQRGAAIALDEARAERADVLERHRRLADVDAALSTAAAGLAAAEGAVPTAEALHRAAAGVADEAEAAATGIDATRLTAQAAALTRAEQLLDELGARTVAAVTAQHQAAAAEEGLADLLGRSPFADLDAARSARLDAQVIQDALAEEQATGGRAAELTAVLQELETLGIPERSPALDAAERTAVAAEERAATARARAASLQTLHATADRHSAAHAAFVESTVRALATSERTARAAKVFASGGATGLSFRQWVLGSVLDEVLDAAAVHLMRMSSGRYGLRRRAGSLDLEVTDAHTGRPRPVASLSGGEQFQASLGLALGLADVIGRGGTASGHRYDALFVDEGFGSLDPHALSQAVEALYDLQAGGRTVAVITHVEAMKQELHVGIDVRRRPDGRGSVLSVHP